MDEQTKAKKSFDFTQYAKVVGFLTLEILAIVAFSLGSSFTFFTILGVIIFALAILVTYKQINKEGLTNFGFFLFPILIYGFLSSISYLYLDPSFIYAKSWLRFLIPFGLISFAGCGYLMGMVDTFKIRHALIVIYSGIALLTLINFGTTMMQFVPFYTLKYKNYFIYYDGSPSPEPIGKMAYFLMNFSLVEVSLNYFSFYPIILLTAFLPLSFIKYKENRKLFSLYLSFGILGLISLIFTINKSTLLLLFLTAIIIGSISVIVRFSLNKKVLRIASRAFVGVFVFVAFFLLCNAQDSVGINFVKNIDFFREMTTGNSLLDKLFNTNGLVRRYNSILDGTFEEIKILGYPLCNPEENFGAMTWPLTDSNSFYFDSFFTSGLFGVIFLTFFIFAGLRRTFMYYANSDDPKEDKVLIVGFIVTSLAYAFVAFDCTPYIFNDTIRPFYTNNIFLIDLFLIGYCYTKSEKKKEVVTHEKAQQSE